MTTTKIKKRFLRLQKNKKNKKKHCAEHRAAAHTAAKAHTQKPNAAVRRQRNRSAQPKKSTRPSIKQKEI